MSKLKAIARQADRFDHENLAAARIVIKNFDLYPNGSALRIWAEKVIANSRAAATKENA